MKKIFTSIYVLLGLILGLALTVNAATSVFNSNQVGTSTPTSGFVLQSLGNNTPAKWVATSTLGITAGGSGTVGSGTTGQIPFYAGSGTTLTATSTIFLNNQNVGIGTASPLGIFDVKNNGIDFSVGSSGCGAGFLYLNFSASPTCSNYSFLGDGSDTYLNGVGAVHIRNSNGNDILNVTSGFGYGELLMNGGASGTIINALGGDMLIDETNGSGSIRIRPGSETESGTFLSNGNFGVQNTNPTFTVDIGSKVNIDPWRVASSSGSMTNEILKSGLYVQNGVVPTIATSTGVGTGSAPASIVGSSNKVHITITTGTSPTGSSALIGTVTLPQACPTATIPVISDANSNSDALGITSRVFASSTSASAFGLYSGSAGLTGATTYMWNVDIGCY